MLYLFMLLAISSIHSGNETFQLRNCRGKVVLVLLERFLKMGARLEGDYEDEGEVMIFLDVICILVMVGWFILALFLAAFRCSQAYPPPLPPSFTHPPPFAVTPLLSSPRFRPFRPLRPLRPLDPRPSPVASPSQAAQVHLVSAHTKPPG